MKTLFAFAAVLTLTVPTLPQVDSEYLDSIHVDSVFKYNNEYRYVLPPKQAFYGAVESIKSSPDSKNLAFLADPRANREIPFFPGAKELVSNENSQPYLYIHNLSSGQTTAVLPAVTPNSHIESFCWLNGTTYLAVITGTSDQNIVTLIDAVTGRRNDYPLGMKSPIYMEPYYLSNSRTLAIPRITMVSDGQVVELQLIDLSNKRVRILPLKWNFRDNFQSDGKNLYTCTYDWDNGRYTTAGLVDLQTGEITPVEPRQIEVPSPAYFISTLAPLITIQAEYPTAESNPNSPATQQAFLTREGLDGGSTPDGKIAWFTDRSGLNICDIASITAQQFEEMAKNVVKRDAVSRGKQIGTGMMIYGSDYDDFLPPVSNWQDRLAPYVKNNALFNGFTYMLNGENSNEISNPTERILGTIETPFGTAIVYADTHTVWKDRPKP